MSECQVRFAADPGEVGAAMALRRRVFCEEQGLFRGEDRDAVDDRAILIVAVDASGAIVGTVRIHEDEPGLWRGSRLAVERPWRRVASLGTALIRHAVTAAHAHGARQFLAHVQSPNAALFHRLSWRTLDEVTLHGLPHHLMEADLAAYPVTGCETGLAVAARRAA